MKKLLMLALAATLAGQAFAADPIAQRKDVFKQYKPVVGGMGKMVKGETPYNKDEFAKLAGELEALSQKPWQHFPAGSGTGKTDAKPEIWSKPAEWQKAIDNHKAATAKLKQVAAGGDLGAIKVQFGATQKTCKACHDAFRKD
ncbi:MULTISPECIES: c-type cytochrome [Chromobacterium]|uniref:Cytochrome c n=3 Tax=Bacteria TaxID=2 RepID=A0ABS3GS89_9NEIS|nr:MULTISPECIES: cytochrome c [Chromobacterium]AXT45664.1 cytochrome c [Chromobacterium rhizoryzae]MBK0416747.1 cytochrome c [Chromobacterium haemolyticum]MBO0417911.1 cytochrome c [Chromobacterium haemolyticum]MBO0501134.1 cytochrome c [Chromobacterium haemolyticum]MDH0343634.1 cytochrome c [Chromobacterium haemolyticum]